MGTTRTTFVKRNIFWGNISNIVTMILSFINRTMFIYILGPGYLGVSGLFVNVLGILSFTELGIGTAMNFSLYKPVATKDRELIKSLMRLYKIAYRFVASGVLIMGVVLYPFLDNLVNTEIPMSEIRIFYLIFLFNTVSSYFVSYKSSYVSAIQKNYIISNINTIGIVTACLLQIVFLLIFPNYMIYLLIHSFVGLLQKIIMVYYINRKFPILTEGDVQPVDTETKKDLWKNVRALMVHKLGDISVHQTDNIIISVFISTTTVGLMSNYITLNLMVAKFTKIIMNSFTASLGNLIAKDSKAKQEEIFDSYDFIGFWIYGFVTIAFVTLSQKFITLWIGKEMLVDNLTMVLFFASIYLQGISLTTYNFKISAGKFNEDKWVSFAQAVVNLAVSILAVKWIGLPGVYVGTIAQRLIVIAVRPYVVYRFIFDKSSKAYFWRTILRVGLIASIAALMTAINTYLLPQDTVVHFLIMVLLTGIVPNLIIFMIYRNTPSFQRILDKVRRREKKIGVS